MKITIFTILMIVIGLTGCQSMPPSETSDIDSDVCVGEPMVVDDPDQHIDLEEMAKQAECP